jgi:hypothetical protein
MLSAATRAGDLAASRAAADGGGWSGVAQRRLVLTRSGLLERRPGDYEVGAWRGRCGGQRLSLPLH